MKEVTTLDHVSSGRGQLAVGAGWFELEHLDVLGFEFGTPRTAGNKLEEALKVITGMLAGVDQGPGCAAARTPWSKPYFTSATVEDPTDDRRSAARRRRCASWHNTPTSRT